MDQLWNPVKRVADSALGAFGPGRFGQRAEAFAHRFGTPGFLLGQTLFVAAWIVANTLALAYRWDPYPFILLNLVFSLQAAYAAPLILLAQAREAERTRLFNETDREHRESIAEATLSNQVETLGLIRELLEKARASEETLRLMAPSDSEKTT